MPQLKQPSDLCTLSINSLESYLSQIVQKQHDLHLEHLHDFLYSRLPAHLCDRLSQALLRVAEDLNLSEVIRHVFIHSRVSVLETHQLYLLNEVPHLQVLKLHKNFTEEPNEQLVLQGISRMARLKYFYMDGDCTDNIVAALALHCPHLESLIILFSLDVTDRSVDSICSLQYLQNLGLQNVDISADGFNRFHQKEEAPFLSLQHLDLSPMVSRDFDLSGIVDTWPNLAKVGLDYIHDLTVLASLEHLQELRVGTHLFETHNMMGLLSLRGKSLTSLYLSYVKDLDLELLCELCPALRILTLSYCTLLDISSSTMHRVPSLHNLEQLSFSWCMNEQQLSMMLRRCDQLKSLEMYHVIPQFVPLLEGLLKKNCLQKLEHFSLGYNTCVTMDTVRLIVFHCPQLKTLSGLSACCAISRLGYIKFCTDMEILNFDLTLDDEPPD